MAVVCLTIFSVHSPDPEHRGSRSHVCLKTIIPQKYKTKAASARSTP